MQPPMAPSQVQEEEGSECMARTGKLRYSGVLVGGPQPALLGRGLPMGLGMSGAKVKTPNHMFGCQTSVALWVK